MAEICQIWSEKNSLQRFVLHALFGFFINPHPGPALHLERRPGRPLGGPDRRGLLEASRISTRFPSQRLGGLGEGAGLSILCPFLLVCRVGEPRKPERDGALVHPASLVLVLQRFRDPDRVLVVVPSLLGEGYSGCRLNVARLGGTSDATLSPVLH